MRNKASLTDNHILPYNSADTSSSSLPLNCSYYHSRLLLMISVSYPLNMNFDIHYLLKKLQLWEGTVGVPALYVQALLLLSF